MQRILFCCALVFMASCGTEEVNENNFAQDATFLGVLEAVDSYGGSGDETAQAVVSTTDGGFAVLGYTNSTNGDLANKSTGVNDYWLLKFSAAGALQWQQTYGGSKDDRGQALVQTRDGGYALTGYAMSSDGDGSQNQGFHDNWLLKLDPSGTIEWEKSFGFSGHDHSYDILQTEDNGFFFTGFLDITSARADGYGNKGANLTRHGVGEFWSTKIDARGNLQWRGYFGGSNNDRAHAVARAQDGGFVMAGFTESNDYDISATNGSYDFWLVKTDANGNFLWERSFGGSGVDIAHDIITTQDGGHVVVGSSFSTDGDVAAPRGQSDVWMIKVDDDGTLLWERSFGGADFDAAQAVFQGKEGSLYLVGNSKSGSGDLNGNAGENDMWLLKTDPEGKLQWQRPLGGSQMDFAHDVLEMDQGGLIVVGETNSPDFPGAEHKGGTDLVVVRLR
ncbi:hypothetical protein [Maribacter sp. 2307ULW6-5]|uniref:hypothetical protein n=1 Tax=Maribacter sp. 2307ULW6-5 TaxID=3386275 RepID=UPI0039BD51BA